jgi:hypothetical protein
MMRRRTAALYCDLTIAEFEREALNPGFPAPVQLGRQLHWSRPQIDAYLERLTGDRIPDWRESAKLYQKDVKTDGS